MFDKDGKLNIFEDFRVDHRLPKFQKARKPPKTDREVIAEAVSKFDDFRQVESADSDDVSEGIFVNTTMSSNMIMSTGGRPMWADQNLTRWQRFKDRLAKIFHPVLEEHVLDRRRMSIHDFFASVKNSTDELMVVRERSAGYERAMKKAKETGQTALFEKLQEGLNAARVETQLIAMGLNKCITEEVLVSFVKKASRGLRLDWIVNFTRLIPEEVVARKNGADERGLFDNYVILHYDPGAKSWAETEAEKAKRKDPILFGVIRGRRQLYFVGDWVDELCNLTFDQIADVVGKDSIGDLSQEPVVKTP